MKKLVIIIVCICGLLAVSGCKKYQVVENEDSNLINTLTIEYISVGNGDATIIAYEGKASIIDTGYVDAGEQILNRLIELGISEVDYMILTHMHSDHIGGAADILKGIQVNNIIAPDVSIDTDVYQDLVKTLGDQGRSIEWPDVTGKTKYNLGTIGEIKFFHPFDGTTKDKMNQYSIVTQVIHGDLKFLFCGDLDRSSLDAVADYGGELLESSMLLFPHHGSKTALSERFIDCVKPRFAMMSYGHSQFGFKNNEVTQTLRSKSIGIGDMYENKSYRLVSDGVRFDIKPFDFYIDSTNERISDKSILSDGSENIRAIPVYVSSSNYKYHVEGCKSISSESVVSLEVASEELEPCELCNPPIVDSHGKKYIRQIDNIGTSEIVGIVGDVIYGSPGVSKDKVGG